MSAASLKPEEIAREKIDRALKRAGWAVVSREDYSPNLHAAAIKESLLKGQREADYMLFLEGKAIAILEAKRDDIDLEAAAAEQAEAYAHELLDWETYWEKPLPFVYLANGNSILFKNLKDDEPKYVNLNTIHSPEQMAKLAKISSYFVGLPTLKKDKLRQCQYEAICNLESSFRQGQRRALICLATGAGKTFTACMAIYRLLTYTPARRILFLVDRNNLGRQAEGEFGTFDLTEKGEKFSNIYLTEFLRSTKVPSSANLVICTIQRLYSVLTGQELQDDEDEESTFNNTDSKRAKLAGQLHLPNDFFDFIVIDECHRSIYGRWRSVLDYFDKARIIGLTATPSEETKEFFNNNCVANYTLEKSIVDGINVDGRIYRIRTEVGDRGGQIEEGEKYTEVVKRTGEKREVRADELIPYSASDLDRAVTNPEQIKTVLEAYKKAIYTDLYPERAELDLDYHYIPKTLIFAKNKSHARNIVEIIRHKVFPNQDPQFVQQITDGEGDSNALIRSFRNDKQFRIAVTVTLVATGTDVKPLEVLIFMRDVNSESLYIQMKGRGVRTINDDALRNVTPNANSKDLFYLIDAIGVTEHVKSANNRETIPQDGVNIPMPKLLEQITHGYLPDDNLRLLASRLSRIANKAERKEQDKFEDLTGTDLQTIASHIFEAAANGSLDEEPFVDSNQPNLLRKRLVSTLTTGYKASEARKQLLDMNAGLVKILRPGRDVLVESGFSQEKARETVQAFEEYVQRHRDTEEAIKIIAENKGEPITYAMLEDLKEKMAQADTRFRAALLWSAYATLQPDKVDKLKNELEKEALTNLIQLVRYALKITNKLYSLHATAKQRFELWCGQTQRGELSPTQRNIAEKIANYIVSNGNCTRKDLLNLESRGFVIEACQAFGSAAEVDKTLNSLASFVLVA